MPKDLVTNLTPNLLKFLGYTAVKVSSKQKSNSSGTCSLELQIIPNVITLAKSYPNYTCDAITNVYSKYTFQRPEVVRLAVNL